MANEPTTAEAKPGFHENFVPDVFAAELASILSRNPRAGGSDAPLDRPDVRHGLVGLALSGGGIRSATFNLGVVQALDEHDVFARVDYLSTVSGGGYIGACVSSILAQKPALPFRHHVGELEHAAFRHLRDHANYLAPGGIGKALRLPALLVQGMVRNLFAVLPIVLLVAAGVLWSAGGIIWWRLSSADHAFRAEHWLPALAAGGIALVWTVLAAPLLHFLVPRAEAGDRSASPARRRDRLLGATTLVYAAAVAVAFLNAQIWVVALLTLWRFDLPIVAGATAALTAVTSWGILKRAAEGLAQRYADRLLRLALAILAPLTLWLLAVTLASWAMSPPPSLADLFGVELLTEGEGGEKFLVPLAEIYGEASLLYAAIAVVLGLLFLSLYDVNGASLHAFYRDRLSKAFLFDWDEQTAREPWTTLRANDRQKLSMLRRPYHLVNAALNIQGSRQRNARGRNAHFFFFSPLFVGSDYTGYRATETMEAVDPHLDLAAAMAISGAAVSPNTGNKTNRATRALLGLANLRLGYWLPNPQRCLESSLLRPFGRGASPYCFFLELFGLLDERRRHVYVSDGGHIENLGIFELLRRRCRYIIASDAEADPGLSFNGLAQLIRLARIELGVRIRIDLSQLKCKDGLVSSHCALGRIEYADGQTGELLYIKSCVSGDEDVYVAEYRARCPEFPHETTADQFFDEAQFEAYRALGHHIADELFDGALAGTGESVAAWFTALAPVLTGAAPAAAPVPHPAEQPQ